MSQVLHILRNSLRNTFARRGTVLVNLLVPFLGIVIGISVTSNSGGGTPVNIALVDNDKSALSRDIAGDLGKGGVYTLQDMDSADAEKALASNSVNSLLEIPAGFENATRAGAAPVMVIKAYKQDGVAAWLGANLEIRRQNLRDIAVASAGDSTRFDDLYAKAKAATTFSQELKVDDTHVNQQVTLFSIGFLLMFTFLGAASGIQNMMAEQAARTFRRIRAAPVRLRDYLGANLLSGLAFVLVQVVMVVFALRVLFHIDIGMSEFALFGIFIAFGIAGLAINLFFASVAGSSQSFSALGLLVGMPAAMLSGAFFPTSIMPDFMQKLSYCIPHRWALDAIDQVQNGNTLQALGSIAVVLAFALTFFLIAVFQLSRKETAGQFV